MKKPISQPVDNRAEQLKTRILAGVKDDLAGIEMELVNHLEPRFDLVKKVAGHILFAGGKRLRPLLMIFCARLCNYRGNDQNRVAASFEYLHAATLLHDDLIDQGTLRRGKPAAYTTYGNETAVLTGDFLLARALAVSALTQNLEVVRTIVDITEQMSQGEIDQLDKKGRVDLTETEYLEIIYCKTAVLFQGACRVGGLIAGATASKVKALSDYGRYLGMAFQMTDDLLDYTAQADDWGKQIGTDLKEGKLTLPVIKALERAKGPDRNEIVAMIGNPDFSKDAFIRIITLLQRLKGIEYTQQLAEKYIAQARKALDPFPASQTKGILMDIADYALVRNQ